MSAIGLLQSAPYRYEALRYCEKFGLAQPEDVERVRQALAERAHMEFMRPVLVQAGRLQAMLPLGQLLDCSTLDQIAARVSSWPSL